jgi:hypothetical protein
MKYIYYIIGVLVLLTLILALRLSDLRVEVSEPALVINDRVISKKELDDYAQVGSHHSRGEGFYDTVITRELLIQEAIAEGIHTEERFRKSVEAYYEESLIQAVVDRKLASLSPDVTENMISDYKEMLTKAVRYTKTIYEDKESFENGISGFSTQQEKNFENLSESLQYDLFSIEPGESTLPERLTEGLVVYRLDAVVELGRSGTTPDDKQVREMLADQGRNAMFDAWLNDVRNSAHIEVMKDQ